VNLRVLRRRFLLSLPIAVAVVVVLLAYADLRDAGDALRHFRWSYLPLIVGLTLWNYLLRFGKWHFYLRQIGVRDLDVRTSALLFFSGLSMVLTPGKLGEWLKCYLLQVRTGMPFARSAPVIIAERLSDGLALVALALGGVLLLGQGWELVLLVALGPVAMVTLTRWPGAYRFLLALASRLPFLVVARAVEQAVGSAAILFTLRNLALAVAIGFLSWGGECLAFALVLAGLGAPLTPTLLLQAAFILPVSTLAGSLLLLPGGLGVAEGGITGLTQVLVGFDRGPAAIAALLIRLGTLWFGVSVGLVAMIITTRWAVRPEHAPGDDRSPVSVT